MSSKKSSRAELDLTTETDTWIGPARTVMINKEKPCVWCD